MEPPHIRDAWSRIEGAFAKLDLPTPRATDDYRPPTSFEKAILTGLQSKAHVYAGTADPAAVARRRARNRVARRSRRINRLVGA